MLIKRYIISAVIGGVLMVSCMVSSSAPILQVYAEETWESSTAAGWNVGGDTYGTLSGAALGGHSGALNITGGAAAGIGVPKEDTIYGNIASDTDFTGNYSSLGISYVQFDFYSSGSVPGSPLSLYFLSNQGAGDYIWYYDITPVVGWGENYLVNIASQGSWYNTMGRSSAQFLTDIQDVDNIGIDLVYRDNEGSQLFGIDNFKILIAIPEPETYAMLAIVALSLVMIFRRNIENSFSCIFEIVKG